MVRGRTPDLSWRLMDAQYWASPRLARLTYTRPLTKRQASDYELRPAPNNPDRLRSIREQMKTAAKQAEADRGQAAPKKNAPDRGER